MMYFNFKKISKITSFDCTYHAISLGVINWPLVTPVLYLSIWIDSKYIIVLNCAWYVFTKVLIRSSWIGQVNIPPHSSIFKLKNQESNFRIETKNFELFLSNIWKTTYFSLYLKSSFVFEKNEMFRHSLGREVIFFLCSILWLPLWS